MASASYICKAKAMMPTMVAMLLYILATTGGGEARRAQSTCSDEGTLVYPYWSLCNAPAVYGERYQFTSVGSRETAGSFLAPEWDESNSTYYLRLSEEGADYILTYLTKEVRDSVAQTDNVVIKNADTGRVLAWRQEGEDEYFLVEVEDTAAAAQFKFSPQDDVALPCPLIYPSPVCEAYDIVAYSTSTGLSAYEEDSGDIYFKRSSGDLLAFLLVRSSSTSINKSQQAVIKSVVA